MSALHKTTVVNAAIHEYDVYIGRANGSLDGYFGNPAPRMHRRDDAQERIRTIRAFLHYFRHRMGLIWNQHWANEKVPSRDTEFITRVHRELNGKRLGCPGNCKPALCHGDVYAAWLNDGPKGLADLEARLARMESLT